MILQQQFPPSASQTAKLFDAFARGWKPGEKTSPAQWAEQNIREIPYSPIPGPFRAENSPMIRDVMDEILNPRSRLVCISACIQSGKTLAPEIALAYIIANAPGPALWLDITDESAKDQGEGRLRPLFENCPPVKNLFPLDHNKLRNKTMIFKNGMSLWILGAKNKRNLQRRSIRWLFGDETWLWEPGRMAEAEARVAAFGYLGKCVFASQGSFENDDTDKKFKTTDQKEWCFTCPHCGTVQPFRWSQLAFDSSQKTDTGETDFAALRESAKYFCENCHAEFANTVATRKKMNASAKFVAQNPFAAPENKGFHWNALATTDWGLLAEEFVRAEKSAKKGNSENLKAFIQKRLAETWKEDATDFDAAILPIQSGYKMNNQKFCWEKEGVFDQKTKKFIERKLSSDKSAPALRFLTVDVQQDYFYYVIRAWSPSGASRLITCGIVQSFDELDAARARFAVAQRLTFIDCGFRMTEVHSECAKRGWISLRGHENPNFPHGRGSQTVLRAYSEKKIVSLGAKGKCEMYFFSNLACKDTLANLRANTSGATWEIPTDAPANYIKMLSSEIRSLKNDKPIWIKKGSRPNHYFDCETMSVCAAYMLKIIE